MEDSGLAGSEDSLTLLSPSTHNSLKKTFSQPYERSNVQRTMVTSSPGFDLTLNPRNSLNRRERESNIPKIHSLTHHNDRRYIPLHETTPSKSSFLKDLQKITQERREELYRSLDNRLEKTEQVVRDSTQRVEGRMEVFRSEQKCANREIKNAIHQSAKKSAYLQEDLLESLRKQQRDMTALKHFLMQNKEEGELPRSVLFPSDGSADASSIHAISRQSLSMGQSISQQSLSVRSQISIVPPSTYDEDTAEKESAAELSLAQQKNAELEQKLSREMQHSASVEADMRQIQKTNQIHNSPTQRLLQDLTPSKTLQTDAEKKAEMAFYKQRQSGHKQRMQGRSMLASERVPTSRPRPRTRSQARLDNK